MLASRNLEPKPVAGGGEKDAHGYAIWYGFWRTIAKALMDGRHTECKHGANCAHHDGVEEHW